MKKVAVQYDEQVKFFENVTKVECYCAFDIFSNTLKIYQVDKVTELRMSEFLGFEVTE